MWYAINYYAMMWYLQVYTFNLRNCKNGKNSSKTTVLSSLESKIIVFLGYWDKSSYFLLEFYYSEHSFLYLDRLLLFFCKQKAGYRHKKSVGLSNVHHLGKNGDSIMSYIYFRVIHVRKAFLAVFSHVASTSSGYAPSTARLSCWGNS